MTVAWYACIVALYGLFIGSAINAYVWRLYVGKSWVKGRSMCPDCKHPLAGKDLVPVVSWLWLQGRCRYCKQRIHWQYPVVETLTAGLFGLSAAVLMPVGLHAWIGFAFWLVILTLLLVMAVYDLRWMILPDKVMYPTIVITAGYVMYEAVITHSWLVLRGSVYAAVLAGGMFFFIAAVSRGRAMGGGDIKLAFMMGLLLGLKATALALLIAFNTAAIVGIMLIVFKLKRRRDHIPFGPFLVAGTVFAFLYGASIVKWYLKMNGIS